MSTSAAGTTFTLRTPAHITSCHMTGSWDNYQKRYTMKKDSAAGPGWWTLTLKFGASLQPKRYWYYYILDGYFESHDPNKPTTQEPTRDITLNILDYGVPSPIPSPSSATTISSRGSSRFGSPSSSTGTSPVSATSSRSKRSGRVFSSSPDSSYDYLPEGYPEHYSSGKRTPSPRRANMLNAHIVHPKPRNPMAAHKLTLDTDLDRRSAYRPYSMITTAATTAGDSPVSASSSRSNSSIGSFCSSCSGSTIDSTGSSPTTPLCTCRDWEGHKDGCEYDGYSDEDSCGDSPVEEYTYRVRGGSRRKTYHPSTDAELAHQLRGMRV